MVTFQSFLYSGTELLNRAEFKLCCPLVAKYCPTPCDPMDCNMPGSSVLHYLLVFSLILLSQWCHKTISSFVAHFLCLPSIFPSFRVFSNESHLSIRWSKCWSFSISPSNEYSGLVSFRTDWFDLAVQGTLKSLLQHHNWKASFFY